MKRKYFALLLVITLMVTIIIDVPNVFAYFALEESEPNNSFQTADYIKIKRYSGYSGSQYRVSCDVR